MNPSTQMLLFQPPIAHACPKCAVLMIVSMVTGRLVRGAECFCREAVNYGERAGIVDGRQHTADREGQE